MSTYPTVDPFGSEGIEINLDVENGVVKNASACNGYINQLGLFDESINTACNVFNRTNERIKTPLLRQNGQLIAITNQMAIEAIKTAVNRVKPDQNAIFVAPWQTNEMMYLVQKWARAAIGTDTISSFAYMDVNPMVNLNKNDNVPMYELLSAKHICVWATELNKEHPIAHQLLQYVHSQLGVQVTYITNNKSSQYIKYCDNLIVVKDYHSFIMAINHYLITNNLAHGLFISSLSIGYEAYYEQLLELNYNQLLSDAGVNSDTIATFAKVFMSVPETVVVLSEKTTSLPTLAELKNLMLLTEKQAKPSSGMMYLKSACNSQGIFDMGILPGYGPGFRKIEGDFANLLKSTWKVESIGKYDKAMGESMCNGSFRNIFVHGENPIKNQPKYIQSIDNADFLCVQSAFENETTAKANLILPMNFGIEIGGSYSSSFKTVQNFRAIRPCPFTWNDYNFMASLHEAYGLPRLENPTDIFLEAASFFETGCCGGGIRHQFVRF